MQGGAGPPFRNPPSVWDLGGAFGASLRDYLGRPRRREDGLTRRAEPMLTLRPGPFIHWQADVTGVRRPEAWRPEAPAGGMAEVPRAGERALVVGLGHSGVALSRFLAGHGVLVRA